MVDIFGFVLQSSFYASIVGIAILIIKALLKNKLNARWHYIVWSVLLVKLIVPFGPESAVSIFNTIPPGMTKAKIFHIATSPIAEENMIGRNSLREPVVGQPVAGELNAAKAIPSGAIPGADTSGVPSGRVDQLVTTGAKLESALPYIWLFGVFVILSWLLHTNHKLHRRLTRNSEAEERIKGIFRTSKDRLGVQKDISLVVQETITTPALFGVFKPRILLSPATAQLGDKQLEYILLHELTHYKRKDVLVNYLLLAFQTIHWFNPIIWYFFKRIRQDMELATDEQVLAVLDSTEHKEYGKALLAVLESFIAPRFAPKLIGMVDDREEIENRIKMIKMADFFKRKRKAVVTIGILCVVILSGVLLTNAKGSDGINLGKTNTGQEASGADSAMETNYDAEKLLKYRSPYIGNASNVSNLLNNLPFAKYKNKISLGTKERPYVLTVDYDLTDLEHQSIQAKSNVLWANSAVLFSLIENLEIIRYNIREGTEYSIQDYTRVDLQRNFDQELFVYSQEAGNFKAFLASVEDLEKEISLRSTYYQDFMHLSGLEAGDVEEVRVDLIENGQFEQVELRDKGIITNLLNEISEIKIVANPKQKKLLPPTKGVYIFLSTRNREAFYYFDYTTGGIAKYLPTMSSYPNYTHRFVDTKKIQQVITEYIGSGAQNLDEAVAKAVLKRDSMYAPGEVATEGHLILGTEETDKGRIVKVYALASYGSFGFENGIFTKVSGSGGIPTVMTFAKSDKGRYTLLEYQEPLDGGGYTASLKQMFPKAILAKIERADISDLNKQQEAQAQEYLRSIGRKARVTVEHVEKQLPKIHVDVSNKLFGEMTKYDESLAKYPYWLGTRETVEDGVRYIYETSLGKTADSDLMIFRKTKADGSLVEELRYKIVGREPQRI